MLQRPIACHVVRGCSVKIALESASFFYVFPTRYPRVNRDVPSRRCLLSMNVTFTSSETRYISDFTSKITFAGPGEDKYACSGPHVLGWRFVDLKRDTAFLDDFEEGLRQSGSSIEPRWIEHGYEEAFANVSTRCEIDRAFWASGRSTGTFTLHGKGQIGDAPGGVYTLPLCILLGYEGAVSMALHAAASTRITVTRAKSTMLSRMLPPNPVVRELPVMPFSQGPQLPIVLGDRVHEHPFQILPGKKDYSDEAKSHHSPPHDRPLRRLEIPDEQLAQLIMHGLSQVSKGEMQHLLSQEHPEYPIIVGLVNRWGRALEDQHGTQPDDIARVVQHLYKAGAFDRFRIVPRPSIVPPQPIAQTVAQAQPRGQPAYGSDGLIQETRQPTQSMRRRDVEKPMTAAEVQSTINPPDDAELWHRTNGHWKAVVFAAMFMSGLAPAERKRIVAVSGGPAGLPNHLETIFTDLYQRYHFSREDLILACQSLLITLDKPYLDSVRDAAIAQDVALFGSFPPRKTAVPGTAAAQVQSTPSVPATLPVLGSLQHEARGDELQAITDAPRPDPLSGIKPMPSLTDIVPGGDIKDEPGRRIEVPAEVILDSLVYRLSDDQKAVFANVSPAEKMEMLLAVAGHLGDPHYADALGNSWEAIQGFLLEEEKWSKMEVGRAVAGHSRDGRPKSVRWRTESSIAQYRAIPSRRQHCGSLGVKEGPE